jgi:TnpA family transposase
MQRWQQKYVGLNAIPGDLSAAEIEHFFTPRGREVAVVARRRKAITRFGLILHIGFLRLTGRTLNSFQILPASVLQHVAIQADMTAPQIATIRAIYRRRMTLFQHQRDAMDALGFQDFGDYAERALVAHLRRQAVSTFGRADLIQSAMTWIYDHNYALPGQSQLDDLVRAAEIHVAARLQASIRTAVGAETSDMWITRLTATGPNPGQSLLDWLRAPVGGAGRRDIAHATRRLAELRNLGADRIDIPELSIGRLAFHSRGISRRKAATLSRLREPRRTLEIGCWLRLQLLRLTDTAIEQVDRRVGDLWRKARDTVEGRASLELVHFSSAIEQIRILLDNQELTAVDFRTAVASIIEPLAAKPARSRAGAIRMELAAHPTRLRNLLREAVRLDLVLANDHPLTVALGIIAAQYRNHRTGLPADTPNPFPSIWAPLIEGARSPEERMAAFEVATAMTLKRALRNGSASAPHSIDHRNLDDQLMPDELWQRDRGRLSRTNGWAASLEAYVRKLEQPLSTRLQMLDDTVGAGEINIAKGRFKIPRLPPDDEAAEIEATRSRLFAAIGIAQLPDILVAIDAEVRFSWTLLGRPPASETELMGIYCALLALGTEQSAAELARMLEGISAEQIGFAMRMIQESDALRAASDAVVASMRSHRISRRWGSGVQASADMMSLDATRHLWNARLEPRRGTPAVGTYTHVLDQWSIIYDQPIVLNRRQAGVAIEGVLRQKSAGLHRLAVDTHGFTHFAMAVAKMLGFDLCPRLSDLGDRKLYIPHNIPVPTRLEPVVERLRLGRSAKAGWNDLLKVVGSLQNGYARRQPFSSGSEARRGEPPPMNAGRSSASCCVRCSSPISSSTPAFDGNSSASLTRASRSTISRERSTPGGLKPSMVERKRK